MPPAAPGKKSSGIDDVARQRARARLLKAVQAGKHTASLSAAEQQATVDRCEAVCYSASASRCVVHLLVPHSAAAAPDGLRAGLSTSQRWP